jgi:hypothetical protein
MSFIGKVAKHLSVSVSVGTGRSSSYIYMNDTFLSSGRGYLVTAEIAFKRSGSAWDGAFITFVGPIQLEDFTYYSYIGLPFTWTAENNRLYLYNDPLQQPILGVPHSLRQSAQAYITNGKIWLLCAKDTDDATTYTIWITAIES